MILLKTNKNEPWQFFYEPGRGICQRRGTHIPQILFPDGGPDFDANCDEQGRIHLMTENRAHDLIYFVHDGRDWQQLTLLKSRGTATAGQFRLLPVGRWQNLFYTLTLEERVLLVHHIIDAPASPTVLDHISGNFVCAASDHDTICIFYRKKDGALVSREYLWNQKQWTDAAPVNLSGTIADCLHTPDGGFHFLTYTDEQITYCGTEPLTIEAQTALPPALSYVDGVLWIVWEQEGRVRACRSEDDGARFDAPTRFLSSAATQDFFIRPTHFPHAVCNRALGSIVDGVPSLSIIGKRFSEPFPTPSEMRRLGQEVEEFADTASLKAEIARLQAENEALKKLRI